MEKDILKKLRMKSRDEAVIFLKRLWSELPQACPLCGGRLDFLHKKAKKSNCDWICTACGERYDTIKILKQLNDKSIPIRVGDENQNVFRTDSKTK